MEDMYEWKGLNGQLVTFKKEVGDAEKITYIGSPGVCTPFAEFLAYSVRDKENHFIPLLDIDDCHEFESKPYAMVLKDEVSDPHDSDVVVLLVDAIGGPGLQAPVLVVDEDAAILHRRLVHRQLGACGIERLFLLRSHVGPPNPGRHTC